MEKLASSSKIGVLLRALLFIVGCALALIVLGPFIPKLAGMRFEIVLGTLASAWALLLTYAFSKWDGLNLANVGAALDRRSLPRFAIGIAIGLLIVAAWWATLAVSGYVHWVRANSADRSLLLTSLAFIVLAVREELSFHGYPLQRLNKAYGVWGAQLLVAFVFAAEHFAGGWSMTQALFGAAVGSLLFGMAAIASGGLAIPIGVHAGWNFGHWSLGHKGQAGLWEAKTIQGFEDRAELLAMFAYVVLMGLATLGFWLWYRSGLSRQ